MSRNSVRQLLHWGQLAGEDVACCTQKYKAKLGLLGLQAQDGRWQAHLTRALVQGNELPIARNCVLVVDDVPCVGHLQATGWTSHSRPGDSLLLFPGVHLKVNCCRMDSVASRPVRVYCADAAICIELQAAYVVRQVTLAAMSRAKA